jgi:hypothetical protein
MESSKDANTSSPPSVTESSPCNSRPSHYSRHDPEPITVIEAWGLNFHLANVLKYIVRAPFKGTELTDLRKAAWYLNRWIQVREAQLKGTAIPLPEVQE